MKKGTFLILCFSGAVLSFNVAATAALVPSIATEFALSQFFAGKIIWVYMLAYGIGALIYGPLARFIDARKIELVCVFMFLLANLAAYFSQSINMLFLARFFMGLFGASIIPLGLILIAQNVEASARGRHVGIFFGISFFSSLIGLFLSALIYWRLIFLIPAVAALVLCLLLFFLFPSLKERRPEFKFNYLAALKEKRVISIFTYIFLISLVYHGIQQWLAVYFSQRFNFNQAVISILITFTSLSGVFGELFGGVLADRIGRIRTIDLGIGLMALSVFSLIFKTPVFIIAILMVIWGFGWTANHAGLSTMLTDLPRQFLNEAASLNSSIRFISGGIGVTFGGLLMQRNITLNFVFFGLCLVFLGLFARKILSIKQ